MVPLKCYNFLYICAGERGQEPSTYVTSYGKVRYFNLLFDMLYLWGPKNSYLLLKVEFFLFCLNQTINFEKNKCNALNLLQELYLGKNKIQNSQQ